jgi:hypothetical protein
MIRTQGSEVTNEDKQRLKKRLDNIQCLKRLNLALRQLIRDVKSQTEEASSQAAEILQERLEYNQRRHHFY